MYGYIYRTINLINNKFYIGQHKSPVFDPTYYGSGKILSNKLKAYYEINQRDCSFNKIKCCFELNDVKIYFDSIIELRQFLIEEYFYNPGRRTFQRLMQQGKQNIPFKPFHKNELKHLIGMKIYKIDDDVETNRDECSGVEAEISTAPKDEAQ